MTLRALPAIFSGALLATPACVYDRVLVPAPEAAIVPGHTDIASAAGEGVRAWVQGDAWHGDPRNLPSIFTPVLVTIENHSGKDVRVSYSDFSLVGESGFRYSAIPIAAARPAVSGRELEGTSLHLAIAAGTPEVSGRELEGTSLHLAVAAGTPEVSARETEGAQFQLAHYRGPRAHVWVGVRPRFFHRGFYVAPHFVYVYPGFAPWPYPYAWDPLYYDRYYAYWQEPLPTRDMLAEAMPAGVIQDGGEVSGFVYFQRVTDRERSVKFQMALVNPKDGKKFGKVSIPLEVSR